jgi:hypothetical protein
MNLGGNKMRCPHCNTAVKLDEHGGDVWEDKDYKQTGMGHEIAYSHCPECEELIVLLRYGRYIDDTVYSRLDNVTKEEILYPKFGTRKVEAEVPEKYKKDFLEACAVLPASPKASAAMS